MQQHKIAMLIIIGILLATPILLAQPTGPTVTTFGNVTASPASAALINTSGGSITTMVLNSTTQNLRWKAYVGNVTGTLTLADANEYSIYDWSLTESLSGEVYATRSSSTIDWTAINCSTQANITTEEFAINHTSNPNDNITSTFSSTTHEGFFAGTVEIVANTCFSLHTNVNSTAQSSDFAEVLLHDSQSMILATLIEEDINGYRPNSTFDFQMIVPENGLPGWSSSTAYYFYTELI